MRELVNSGGEIFAYLCLLSKMIWKVQILSSHIGSVISRESFVSFFLKLSPIHHQTTSSLNSAYKANFAHCNTLCAILLEILVNSPSVGLILLRKKVELRRNYVDLTPRVLQEYHFHKNDLWERSSHLIESRLKKSNHGDKFAVFFKKVVKATETVFSVEVNGFGTPSLVLIAVDVGVGSKSISTKYSFIQRPTSKEKVYTASTRKLAWNSMDSYVQRN